MLIVNKAREAAACAEANCASSFVNATNAATSAAAAAQSAEIAGIYLGPYAVAPTTDNEGNPLQEGMLYYNTVSNAMFVWNGTTWQNANVAVGDGDKGDITVSGVGTVWTIDNDAVTFAKMQNISSPRLLGRATAGTGDVEQLTLGNGLSFSGTALNGFNQTTNFTATGTTTARNLEIRTRQDIASVKDWGAVGDGVADDTAAIDAAIAATSRLFFPQGTYKVTAPIIIEKSIRLYGAGSQSSFISIAHSGNGIVFQPTGAGTSDIFLSSCSIADLNIIRQSSITNPKDNIWIRQCSGFRAINVNSNNGSTCFRISGGQLNSLDGCRAFASNTSIVPDTENAGILLEDAELGGGSFQPCYTVNISNLFGSTTNILDYNIKVRSCDGLNISNAYLAFADIANIGFIRQRTNSSLGTINITNVYFDCTGFFGGANTPYAIRVTHSLPAGTYGVIALNVSDCIIANNAGAGDPLNFNALIDFVKHGIAVSIKGCYIANSGADYGVEIHDSSVGGPSGSYVFSGNTFSYLSNDPSPGSGGALYAKDVDQLIISDNNFQYTVTSSWQVLVDGDNGSLSAIGNITDGSATQMVTIAGGATFTGNVVLLNAGQTTTNIVRLALPTSLVGLPSGAMWNNAGVVNIVP